MLMIRAARSGALAPKWRFLEVDGACIFPFGAGRQIHDIWRFLAQFDTGHKKTHFDLKTQLFYYKYGHLAQALQWYPLLSLSLYHIQDI